MIYRINYGISMERGMQLEHGYVQNAFKVEKAGHDAMVIRPSAFTCTISLVAPILIGASKDGSTGASRMLNMWDRK